MKKVKKNAEEIISMNENNLYSNFSIEELEQRLETDPLLTFGMTEIDAAQQCDAVRGDGLCPAKYYPPIRA